MEKKAVFDITDAKAVIKSLQTHPFICGSDFIETENGYVITRKRDKSKPLTLKEVKNIKTGEWVWIEAINLPWFDSAYCKKQEDYTHGKSFTCGYPGNSYGFEYSDYGKRWTVYREEPR